jgi:hypothetical protein
MSQVRPVTYVFGLDRLDNLNAGGEGGIRTPDRLAPMPHFECGAFNHSATSPGAKAGPESALWSGRVLGEDGGIDKARGARNPCPRRDAEWSPKWSI